MKQFVRKYIPNYLFFPLLLVSSALAFYIYSPEYFGTDSNLPVVIHVLVTVFLLFFCLVILHILGHLGASLHNAERVRNHQLIDNLDSVTKEKVYDIFLDSSKKNMFESYNPQLYYRISALHFIIGTVIVFSLKATVLYREQFPWTVESLRLLLILNSIGFWVTFNFFSRYMDSSLKLIKRFSDRCLYYAGENLRRSQIFNSITDVVQIFNDEQKLEPVFKRVLDDCNRILDLDAGIIEIRLPDTHKSIQRVIYPTPQSVTVDEDFSKHVYGRSEINNNLELSRVFKPIAEQGFTSMVHVSLDTRGQEVGYMAGFSRKRRDLRDADLDFFYTFGRQTSMVVENAHLLEKIKLLSVTDGLTGLYNHRYFMDAISGEIRRAVRYDKSLCIVMIDIDYFKHYNDTNGHPGGDKVLKKVAEILSSLTRDTDIVARYGGEEFILLLTETTKEGGTEFAQRLCRTVEEEHFENEEAQPNGKLTISVGVSSCRTDSTNPKELIDLADKSLYKAKNGGRNRVVVHGQK